MFIAPLPAAPAQPPATPWLVALVHKLSEYGGAIIARIHAAATASPDAEIDLATVARALLWAASLAAVLAGDLRLAIRPRQTAANSAAPAPAPVVRRPRAPRTHTLPAGFARLTIAQIATRICAALGITEASPCWPTDLMAITQTPAQWSTTHYPSLSSPRPSQAGNTVVLREKPGQGSQRLHPQPAETPSSRAAPTRQSHPGPRTNAVAAAPAPPPPTSPPPLILPHPHPPPRAPSFRARLLRDTWSLA